MKVARTILLWILLSAALAFVLWRSPVAIGYKLKRAQVINDDVLLLDAAEQLSRFNKEATARFEVAKFRQDVANHQRAEALRLANELIASAPRDPDLLLFRAKVLWSSGEDFAAVADLRRAKELVHSGNVDNPRSFLPSESRIDSMLNDMIAKHPTRKGDAQ
jgi:hypothetical protein